MKMKYHFKIKPLSVNRAWKGKRYKTHEYDKYIMDLKSICDGSYNVSKGKIKIDILFGFSSKGSDIDNPVKPFIDTLQKYYGFNDNQIYKMELEKCIVPKGKEFIKWEITDYEGFVLIIK